MHSRPKCCARTIEAHRQSGDTVGRFVREEIMPQAEAWEEAGEFPRELYRKAAGIGLLGLGFPEEYGGREEIMKDLAARQLGW